MNVNLAIARDFHAIDFDHLITYHFTTD